MFAAWPGVKLAAIGPATAEDWPAIGCGPNWCPMNTGLKDSRRRSPNKSPDGCCSPGQPRTRAVGLELAKAGATVEQVVVYESRDVQTPDPAVAAAFWRAEIAPGLPSPVRRSPGRWRLCSGRICISAAGQHQPRDSHHANWASRLPRKPRCIRRLGSSTQFLPADFAEHAACAATLHGRTAATFANRHGAKNCPPFLGPYARYISFEWACSHSRRLSSRGEVLFVGIVRVLPCVPVLLLPWCC